MPFPLAVLDAGMHSNHSVILFTRDGHNSVDKVACLLTKPGGSLLTSAVVCCSQRPAHVPAHGMYLPGIHARIYRSVPCPGQIMRLSTTLKLVPAPLSCKPAMPLYFVCPQLVHVSAIFGHVILFKVYTGVAYIHDRPFSHIAHAVTFVFLADQQWSRHFLRGWMV